VGSTLYLCDITNDLWPWGSGEVADLCRNGASGATVVSLLPLLTGRYDETSARPSLKSYNPTLVARAPKLALGLLRIPR